MWGGSFGRHRARACAQTLGLGVELAGLRQSVPTPTYLWKASHHLAPIERELSSHFLDFTTEIPLH
jgi:hypothetical protein